MVKNKRYTDNNYNYGSVAYDYKALPKEKIKTKKRNVSKKKIKTNSRLKSKFRFVRMIITIFIMAFMVTVRFTAIMDINSDIRNLKNDTRMLQQDNENIKVELAKLNNIKNLEKIAIEKEGMKIPDQKEVFYVSVKPLVLSSKNEQMLTKKGFMKQLFGVLNRGVSN